MRKTLKELELQSLDRVHGDTADGERQLVPTPHHSLAFLLQMQHHSLERQQILIELYVVSGDLLQHLHEPTSQPPLAPT